MPPEIQRLHALEVLDLDNNKLTSLPAEIGTLQHLQVLRADNNLLTSVPCEWTDLLQHSRMLDYAPSRNECV